MGAIYIGISGWRYEPWRGVFYPPGLVQARELDYASRFLPTIEINGSFYSLQRPSSYAAWYAATPPGFIFAVKGNRFITHMLKLRGIETPLANVLASGVFAARKARPDPVAVPAAAALRAREDRAFPVPAAARHRPGARHRAAP